MIQKLLVANRGEIAVRILRAAAELRIATVAIHPEDDADSLHTRRGDESRLIPGKGTSAYLDIESVIAAAKATGCDAVHPGYGFLSENAAFARACTAAGLRFVGPRAELLELFGDKIAACSAARQHGLPVLGAASEPASVESVRAYFASRHRAPIVIKALAGGGGRGIRVVRQHAEIAAAFARCEAEAKAAFGNGALYVEPLVEQARHIEVQIVGDAGGAVTQVGERDCSLQRRHQKIVEIAPSPALTTAQRSSVLDAAVKFARAVRYENLGTFEFLFDARSEEFWFIEANPRLQVEHTVTEAVTGIDLVQTQLRIAAGQSLATLGLSGSPPEPRGFAIQLRVNAETMGTDGSPSPSGGVLSAFEAPSGPGLRADSYGYAGYRINPRYDSLLAKLIVHSASPAFGDALAKTARALREFRIEGVATNLGFHAAILAHPDFAGGKVHTRWVDEQASSLVAAASNRPSTLHFDPMGASSAMTASGNEAAGPEGTRALRSPMQGTIVSVEVSVGSELRIGQPIAVIDAMKLQHEITAQASGIVRKLAVVAGDVVYENDPLVFIEEGEVAGGGTAAAAAEDPNDIRPNLQALFERRAKTQDAARPLAVEKQRKRGERTARGNLEDLCDPGSFIEYGQMVVAAQRARRTMEDLIANTPADGIITGIGTVNGQLFPEPVSRCALFVYDYSVLAGTQGNNNHRKMDRLIRIVMEMRLPVICFTQGGGGRPGDTDFPQGYDSTTFTDWPRMSGLVPMVAINSGPCFAGNAGILGTCDVVIATKNSNIGMGGPAMIEGGGLGVYKTEEVGSIDVQRKNGVVDIVVEDEAEGVRVAKQYLAYFQGALEGWEAHDQKPMRTALPKSRLRGYEVRDVIHRLADKDSVLELRRDFGIGIVTVLARIEGRPIGIYANNPLHLGGAIDSDASDKGARFINLCDAHDIPLLALMDTPGVMVGPDAEATALVRKSSRMFLAASNAEVPLFAVLLRKAYGLGGVVMAGGNYRQPLSCVTWPSGEVGGMGIEAAVRLGYRKEMGAIADPAEREKYYQKKVDALYESGSAMNLATTFKFDDVIDPAETRGWLVGMMKSLHPVPKRSGKKRHMIDAW